MNIIMLSGGSGKRLWPLSNDIRSKQFIKFLKNEDGQYESMVQRVYRSIKRVDQDADITFATSKTQVSSIRNQIGDNVSISVEPCRKDTFPAIVLAVAFLHDIKHIGLDESVVVCPVDPFVDDDYFKTLQDLSVCSSKEEANLVLMGIEPTYPSEKYGYIIPKTKGKYSEVKEFKEKPSVDIAKEYINQGALWNGGVFAFKIGYLLDKAKEIIPFSDYYDLYNKYDTLSKISFDYAVAEKEPNIKVIRFNGKWTDLGTWNTMVDAMEESIIGNGIIADGCHDVSIINELDVPILAMGMNDVVISASPDGILVSDKKKSAGIKPYVDRIHAPVMYAEKSWGAFKIIDAQENCLTIKVTIKAGDGMRYHSHKNRDEVWVISSGTGRTIVDGMEQTVRCGDVITMQAGCKHIVVADTDMTIIEVQLGKDINVEDKEHHELK